MFGYIMKDLFSAKKPHAETNWNKDLRKQALSAGLHPVDSLQRSQGKLYRVGALKAGMLKFTVYLKQGHEV